MGCASSRTWSSPERIGSIDKAERLLGFRATIPLREGLRSVVEWRLAQRSATSS